MDSNLLLSYKEAACVRQTLCGKTNLFSYILGSFLSVRHTLQKTAHDMSTYKLVRFWEWRRWRNKSIRNEREEKNFGEHGGGTEWQPFVTFSSVVEARLFVCTWQIQKFVFCMLLAVKPRGTSWAPMNTCLYCNYIGGWIGRLGVGGGSITRITQPQHRRPSVYWSSSINVWGEFIYTRAGCWTYLIWRPESSANWQVQSVYTEGAKMSPRPSMRQFHEAQHILMTTLYIWWPE
jgi:hypothetical protein